MTRHDWNEVQLAAMRACLAQAREAERLGDDRGSAMFGGQAVAHLIDVVSAAKLRPLRRSAHPAADLRRAA